MITSGRLQVSPDERLARRASSHARVLTLRDGRTVKLRAIREGDAQAIQRAFERLSPESRYQRFLQHKQQLNPAAVARGVRPRPGRDKALVATVPSADGYDIVGAAQYVQADEGDGRTCEFAITLAEDWRGCGLAYELMASLVRRARRDSYECMLGLVLAENAPMLALAQRMGFEIQPHGPDSSVVRVLRRLRTEA